MSVSDANPAGDSPEVAALKVQLAEAEARQAAQPEVLEKTAADAAPVNPNAPSPEVSALQAQLKEQMGKVEELTNQLMAQKDPETAVEGLDVKALLNQLVAAQAEYREEITQLRAEVAKGRRPLPATTARPLSAEELLAIRMQQLGSAAYYCPGCGALYKWQRECVGTATAPHPAIEVAPTEELLNPPDSSDQAAVKAYQAGHTAMQYVDPAVNDTLLGG